MANSILRDKAIVLRREGKSLNEITDALAVPKSTVRYWCRDVVLSEKELRRLSERTKIGGLLSAEKRRKERLLKIEQLRKDGVREIGKLSRRNLFLVGVALYWAEGYRKGDGEFGFTNSDPKMIKLILKWLMEVCGILQSGIHCRICINSLHKDRIKAIENFWTAFTSIPLSQFSKPTFIKTVAKKRYLNSTEYFGTLRIKVRKSKNLKRKIMGWVEGISLM